MSVALTVKDVGPVAEFAYQLEQPGLHVLVGEKGCGKSTILRTLEMAVGGDPAGPKPTKRDGAKGGQLALGLDGKEFTLKISRTTRTEGELGVEGLGDLDITVLHTPKFEKPAVRDKYRIAALAKLAGLEGKIEDFRGLVTDEDWNTFVGPKVSVTDDIVELAARIKRALDCGALDMEKRAAVQDQTALSLTSLFEGIDLSSPCDPAELAAAHAAAAASVAAIQQRNRSAAESNKAVAASREALENFPSVDVAAIEAERDAKVAQAEDATAAAIRQASDMKAEVAVLRQKLSDAESRLATSELAVQHAQKATREIADAYAKKITTGNELNQQRGELEKAIEAGIVAVDLAAETAAIEAAEQAQQAMMNGQRVIDAIAAKEKYDRCLVESKELTTRSKKLRQAAQVAMDRISDALGKIQHCPLRVKLNDDGEARLVIATDRSDAEPFDDLSDGERWSVIVPLCLGFNRLVTLPQAAFGEMPPSTRAMLSRLAREAGAYLVSSVAKDCSLEGMPYEQFAERFKEVALDSPQAG